MTARERATAYGAGQLEDRELLDLVAPGAGALLERAGNLARLAAMTRAELLHAGATPARADRVLAAIALGRRTFRTDNERRQLKSPRETAAYLLPRYGAAPVEHFGVLLMDTRCRLLADVELYQGTLDATTVHPREVFNAAIVHRACSLICWHNHPSGDVTASPDDVRLTARIVRAGEVIGIDVVDHLILSGASYYSFRESGGLATCME